jgi:adhesin transport system membrane fusion protein
VTGRPLTFPESLRDSPDLIDAETALYQTRRRGLEQTLAGIQDSLPTGAQRAANHREPGEDERSSRVEVIR